ncbi:MAG: ATP-binding protein [Chthoniobacteraceae bacterium]
MNLAPYIPLSGFVVNMLFGLFVFSRDRRAPANRVYLLLAVSIAIWNLGCYHLLIHHTREEALFWARFVFVGCIIGVVAFFHLAMIVAGFRVKWISWLYVFQAFLVATDCTSYFIRDVQFLGSSGWYAVAGPMFYVFVAPFTLMFGSIFVLLKRRRELPLFQRRRLTPIIVAQSMLSVFGANDLLPVIGIYHYPLTQVQVYPWGSLAAVFYGVITAYSVLQHQLLDIQVNIGRYAAHIVRVLFLFSITLGLLLVASAVTDAFNPTAFGAAVIVFLASTIIAAFLFPRLFGKGVETLERRILGDRFEYQDRVRAFIQALPWQNDLDALLEDLHLLLTRTFGLRGYDLILRDEAARAFTRSRAHPELPREHIPELKIPSPVMEFFEWRAAEYLVLSSEYQRGTVTRTERLAREQLAGFSADFCLPLLAEKELVGLLFVGAKTAEEPYTSTDLQLLINLAKNLSLIVNQIRLKEEIMRAQEFDLLGRMSRGMAHDLNNLLTPISTLIQLATEGQSEAALDEDLLSVASRNVRSFRAYIKEALFFSENLRPDLQVGRLDFIVENAVDAARATRRKDVRIVAETPGEVSVEIDEVLIQRLLNNLISNSVDASSPGGEIRVVLDRLAKTEAARDWFRLRVIDQGEGIPTENLDRVLRPYFTTKDRGDEARGFGLGLAISRRIVALHGGQLTISSQVRRGTVVQIDLPSRPFRAQLPPVQPETAPTPAAA